MTKYLESKNIFSCGHLTHPIWDFEYLYALYYRNLPNYLINNSQIKIDVTQLVGVLIFLKEIYRV